MLVRRPPGARALVPLSRTAPRCQARLSDSTDRRSSVRQSSPKAILSSGDRHLTLPLRRALLTSRCPHFRRSSPHAIFTSRCPHFRRSSPPAEASLAEGAKRIHPPSPDPGPFVARGADAHGTRRSPYEPVSHRRGTPISLKLAYKWSYGGAPSPKGHRAIPARGRSPRAASRAQRRPRDLGATGRRAIGCSSTPGTRLRPDLRRNPDTEPEARPLLRTDVQGGRPRPRCPASRRR